MEFNQTVNWEKSSKVCKMTQLKKDGKVFFIGDLSKNIKLTLHKMGGDFGADKAGNPFWNLSFVPVSYTKIEAKQEPEFGKNTEEVPF